MALVRWGTVSGCHANLLPICVQADSHIPLHPSSYRSRKTVTNLAQWDRTRRFGFRLKSKTTMTSIQEALSDALEHPLAEPRRSKPKRPKGEGPKIVKQRQPVFSTSVLWGALGSLGGFLVMAAIYRKFKERT